MTAMELYRDSVRQLPAIERLRLALLILKDLTPADLVKRGDAAHTDDQVDDNNDDDGTIKLVNGPG